MLLFGSPVCQWAAQPRTKAGTLINRWFENAAERFLPVVRLPAIVAVARPPQPQRPARALPWPWRNSAGWTQNAVSALTTFPGRVWSLRFKGLPRRIVCFCLDAVTQQKVARGGGGGNWKVLSVKVQVVIFFLLCVIETSSLHHGRRFPGFISVAAARAESKLGRRGRTGRWDETRATSGNPAQRDSRERPGSESGPRISVLRTIS